MFTFLVKQVLFLVKKVKVTAAFSSIIIQITLSLSASLSAAPSQKLPEGHPRLKAYIRNTRVSKTIV